MYIMKWATLVDPRIIEELIAFPCVGIKMGHKLNLFTTSKQLEEFWIEFWAYWLCRFFEML